MNKKEIEKLAEESNKRVEEASKRADELYREIMRRL